MTQSSTNSAFPWICDLLVERIDRRHRSVGIVVGLIASTGRRTISYGKFDSGDNTAVDDNTIFEIGSDTQAFTSLLLAGMVQRGEVALTDSVAKYLPACRGKDARAQWTADHPGGVGYPLVWSPAFAFEPKSQSGLT